MAAPSDPVAALRQAPTLSAERWAQVRELLEAALDREQSERAEFLREACGPDEQLRAEIESLLGGLERSPSFLEEPVFQVSSDAEDTLVGTAVGPWRLLRRIGDGGTASVYAAARSDHEFRKVVAVKLIKAGMDYEEVLRRFRNERQILAALDHPNITRLLDGGSTAAGLPYLVMEYVEGVPISQYCATHKLSITERLQLFRTVCTALAYAHQNLIVHRDLKPANILVNPQGVPKVLDFGIGKLLRPESSGYTATFTRTQMRMMTPEYASPEQVRGDPITTASDIYSLGVVLYELLAGRRPYRLKTGMSTEIEQAICEWEPERPSAAAARSDSPATAEETPQKLSRRLRGDLDAIVMMALRKEPQRRYPTVDRLSEDIDRHLRRLPVSASKDTWTYRAAKFTRRHKVGVAITALTAAVLVFVTIFSTYLLSAERKQKKVTYQLIEFMLNDLDNALKSGATSARKALVDDVLARLTQLSSGRVSDPDLRVLLVTAYLKLGDIQGNMFTNNLGDPSAARQSYQRARQFARSPGEIAEAERRLGDMAFNSGQFVDALASYQRVAPILDRAIEENPKQKALYPAATTNWYRIGFMELQMGRVRDALASYEHEIGIAQQQFDLFPDSNVRRELGMSNQHAADALQQLGRVREALARLQSALSIYQELRKEKPNSLNLERLEGTVYVSDAETLRQEGQFAQAEEMYEKGLNVSESLLTKDPHNEKYQEDRNGILPRLAEVDNILGRTQEARRLSENALAEVRPLTEKPHPSPDDLYQYSYDLVTTPFPDLRRPDTAMQCAQEAVRLTAGSDPEILDVLARAWDQNGNLEKAIETETRALARYPKSEPVIPGTARDEMRKRLDDWEHRRESPGKQ
jgi:eukaryotic-like serine/threonine-protein kinase